MGSLREASRLRKAKAIGLFLRREPTTDSVMLYHPEVVMAREILGKALLDVQAYADSDCTSPVGRWPWHYRNKPTRRNRRVMLNCYEYKAVWLPDAESAGVA